MGSFRDAETKGQPAAQSGGTYRQLDLTAPKKPGLADDIGGALATLTRAVPGLDEANDYIYAKGKTGADLLTGKAKPRAGENGVDYVRRVEHENLTAARSRSKAAADDFGTRHPIAADLTKGFGMVAPAAAALFTGGATAAPAAEAAAPGLIGQLRSFATSMGKGGLVGALTGDLSGLASEGTLSERAHAGNAAIVPGAALGMATPVAMAAAGAAARGVGRAGARTGSTAARLANRVTGGQLLDPRREAAVRLREAMEKDGLAPADIMRGLSEWNSTGASSPALMDLAGENTRALLRSAASKPGAGRNAAVEYANQVTGDLQSNAIARTRALTADRRPATKVVEGLKKERGAAAREMYPAFAEERVAVTPEVIDATDGTSDWMHGAAQLARAERRPDVLAEIEALTSEHKPGDPLPDNISAGALDYMRRALRDRSGKAFTQGEGGLGAALKDRSRELETVLTDVPGFDKARSTYRGFSNQIDAVDAGKGVLNEVPDDFAGHFETLPVEHGGIGGRQALEEAIGRPTEGATGTLNRIASSTNTRRNLSTLYGDEEAGRYADAIGRETERVSNARFVSPNTGSQTQLRDVDDALIDLPPMSKLGIVKAIIDKVRRGVSLTDAERAALVEYGTTRVTGANDIPQLPERSQPLRLSPEQRARMVAALSSGEGQAIGQRGGR
jgi:hypothetical protein